MDMYPKVQTNPKTQQLNVKWSKFKQLDIRQLLSKLTLCLQIWGHDNSHSN